MKVMFVSFAIGLGVGVIYGLIRVKSPAPPIVALLGLFGMVLGEQAGVWFLTKKIQTTNVYSAHIVSELKLQQQPPCSTSSFAAVAWLMIPRPFSTSAPYRSCAFPRPVETKGDGEQAAEAEPTT
jgi:XapX domain-containing protein